RITFATRGTNTRGQALDIRSSVLHNKTSAQITLVTTPQHTYRTFHVFRKLDFERINTFPTFENDMKAPLIYSSRNLDGKRFVPDVGNNQKLRYQLWTHLKYEITLLREYTAIMYYKLQGWI
ncbi:MAG: ElyC/SanA/YdcF family protein, partial [Salinivirgaceae bacterium]